MEVGRRRVSGVADLSDDLALGDSLSVLHLQDAAVHISGREAVAMVDRNHVPAAAVVSGVGHRAGSGCLDGGSGASPDVIGCVELPVMEDRVDAPAVSRVIARNRT